MSSPHLVRVNRAINAASKLTWLAIDLHAEGEVRRALLEAALMQLRLAMDLYARELADTYQLPDVASINSIEQLRRRFVAAQKTAIEMDELGALIDEPQSWLAHLLRAARHLTDSAQKTPTGAVRNSLDEGGNLIAVSDSGSAGDNNVDVDFFMIENWIDNTKALFFRQRQTSCEY